MRLEITIRFSLLSFWQSDELNVYVDRALGFTGNPDDLDSQPISRHISRTIEVNIPEYMMEMLMTSREDEKSDVEEISTFMEVKVSGGRDVTKAECRMAVCSNCGENDWTKRTVWTDVVDGVRSHIDDEWFTCCNCDAVVNKKGEIFQLSKGLTLD